MLSVGLSYLHEQRSSDEDVIAVRRSVSSFCLLLSVDYGMVVFCESVGFANLLALFSCFLKGIVRSLCTSANGLSRPN